MSFFICKPLNDLCSQEFKVKYILHNSLHYVSKICEAALSYLWLWKFSDHASFLKKTIH